MLRKLIFALGFISSAFAASAISTQSATFKGFYEVKSCSDTNRKAKEVFIEALQSLQPSLQGVTEKGNKYNLYAFRVKREWNYIILDSIGYYSIKQRKKSEVLEENSTGFTEMLCMMIKADMIKKKSKSKTVSGLTFSCHYKLTFKARKLYRSMSKVYKEAKIVKEALQEGPKGAQKLLE